MLEFLLPQYICTYDVKIVINYLASLDLSMKLVLILLSSGQRIQFI